MTAELPQVNTYVQVRLAGSGQIQQRMEKLDPGSFAVLMSGIKSDVISLVHGDFRKQFVGFYTQNGGKAKESSIDLGASMSDDSIHMEVHIRMTFGRDLPGQIRQNSASALMAACFQFTSASVERAETILASAAIPAAHPRSGMQQVDLPPEAIQQLLAQQGMQTASPHVAVLARASSDDTTPTPGQYL